MRKTTLLLLGLAAAAQAVAATASTPSTIDLAPNPSQIMIARTVFLIAQKHHYPQEKLNSKLAHAVLDEYFNTLDPSRFYLTDKAIKDFLHAYDKQMVDDLRQGSLKPAFAIYRYYNNQVHRQIRYALKLLNQEPDFSKQGSFRFARRHAPWATDQSALNKLWRERVKNDALVIMLGNKSWADAAKALTKRYQNALKNIDSMTSAKVFGTYINAYMQTLDPHSSYFTALEVHQLLKRMNSKMQGIGIQLTVRNGYVTVARTSAADHGKLKPGDRIVGVGQGESGKIRDVIGSRLDNVSKQLRGPEGTKVRLRVMPAGALPGSIEKTVTLVRHAVKFAGERAHASVAFVTIDNHAYKIGIIKIPSLYENYLDTGTAGSNTPSVTSDVKALLSKLEAEKVSGILLDLRNNGGGALEQAADLAGLFIPRGPVVQIRGRSGQTQQLVTPNGETPAWSGPLAVLINRFSASGTEIFAGALKDYHRAVILGTRTWGSGTVQTIVSLNKYLPGFGAGEIKLTVAQFFRFNGSSTQLRGISPDITIPSPINDEEFGENMNRNVLPWKSVAPANYKPEHYFVSRSLPKLQNYFRTTVQKEPGYQIFAQESARERNTAALTTVSLSLKVRRNYQTKEITQTLAFDNAWRKLEGKPTFKDLQAADNSHLLPPDIPLEVGKELLGDYINLLPREQAPFKGIITTLPSSATSNCVGPLQTARRPGGCVERSVKVIQPPTPGTTTGG